MSTLWVLLTSGLILRCGLLIYGSIQDAQLQVPFTDIDYRVFTDAALYVSRGRSPYGRETYRYTPLLAYMMLPNQFLPVFGKILFCAADLGCGVVLYRILERLGENANLSALWIVNPFVATISARGSAESLVALMLVCCLYELVVRKRAWLSGIWYGLAVHFKIFPIIYSPTFLVVLSRDLLDKRKREPVPQPARKRQAVARLKKKTPLAQKVARIFDVNAHRMWFAFSSALTFLSLLFLFVAIYGEPFLENTYLYHITRKDHRHNFSLYSYYMYLSTATEASNLWESLASFVPQFAVVGIIGAAFGRDLFLATFLQTVAFVTWNKVITSQYFVWYITLLPLVLAHRRMRFFGEGIRLIIPWLSTQGLWLHYAYGLEFLGENNFRALQVASGLHFLGNVGILLYWITQVPYIPLKPVISK